MMNATLYPGPDPGFARQYPNEEADAMWDELELLRTIPISKDDVLKLGKDPETVAKFEDKYWGLGDDAYMAQIDVFHQYVTFSPFTIRRGLILRFEDYTASTNYVNSYIQSTTTIVVTQSTTQISGTCI